MRKVVTLLLVQSPSPQTGITTADRCLTSSSTTSRNRTAATRCICWVAIACPRTSATWAISTRSPNALIEARKDFWQIQWLRTLRPGTPATAHGNIGRIGAFGIASWGRFRWQATLVVVERGLQPVYYSLHENAIGLRHHPSTSPAAPARAAEIRRRRETRRNHRGAGRGHENRADRRFDETRSYKLVERNAKYHCRRAPPGSNIKAMNCLSKTNCVRASRMPRRIAKAKGGPLCCSLGDPRCGGRLTDSGKRPAAIARARQRDFRIRHAVHESRRAESVQRDD